MSASFTTIDININKSVALDRSAFRGVAVLDIAVFVVVVAVTATINFIDGGAAGDSYIGVNIS